MLVSVTTIERALATTTLYDKSRFCSPLGQCLVSANYTERNYKAKVRSALLQGNQKPFSFGSNGAGLLVRFFFESFQSCFVVRQQGAGSA